MDTKAELLDATGFMVHDGEHILFMSFNEAEVAEVVKFRKRAKKDVFVQDAEGRLVAKWHWMVQAEIDAIQSGATSNRKFAQLTWPDKMQAMHRNNYPKWKATLYSWPINTAEHTPFSLACFC